MPVTIELKNENQFRLTPEELLAAITDKTKILILAFPSNPTGAVMTKEDLEPIAKICQEKDIYVISDEIYSCLLYTSDLNKAAEWMKRCDDRNVSYCVWSLCNKNESSALIKSSCGKTSGWTVDDLTLSLIHICNVIPSVLPMLKKKFG